MRETARATSAEPPQERTPEQEATARAAGLWIGHLARTLKTCRLYDSNNPTVVRFRAELAQATARLLEQHSPMRLRFSSDDVTCEGESLYPARSREDNLALPFYRDGVRGLALHRGVIAHEVDALIDAVLHVTSQNQGDNDLVTMLWEAQLAHIEVDVVPAEGEIGTGFAEDLDNALLPWPGSDGGEPGGSTDEADGGREATVETVGTAAREDRSDDWTAGDLTVEIEAGHAELEAMAPTECERFRHEFRAEHEVPVLTSTLAIGQAYLAAGANADDRAELGRFVPRLLRQAVAQGNWLEARAAIALLRGCEAVDWSPSSFLQELLQPISVSGLVERLDAHEAGAVEFVALSDEFLEGAVDLLNLVLAESQSRVNRRVLAEAIARRCRDNPERLAPWISDPRWFVVRNVVHILGWIGTPEIVGLLQTAVRNPDPRVRQEVVAALGQVDAKLARPLLMRLMDGADTRMLTAVLHQLSAARDPGVARTLLRLMQAEAFDERPLEEQRAIYSALSTTGDDAILGELEMELHKGGWFSRNQEAHRQAVARCIARIGTAQARAILEAGLSSRRQPLRKACEDALGGFHARD